MKARAFVETMIATGSVLGVALAAQVPTRIDMIARGDPGMSSGTIAADYPELSPSTIDSYPVAVAPIMRQSRLHLAAWEEPIAERSFPPDEDPDFADSVSHPEEPPRAVTAANVDELVPEDETFSELTQNES